MTDSNQKIFVDTAPFIYYLEINELYYDKTLKFFRDQYHSGCQFITSAITVEEYCTYPIRINRLDHIQRFESFVADLDIFVSNVDYNIGYLAAKLRAKYLFLKAFDAVQFACAIQHNCNLFLTNDKQLKQVSEIQVVLVNEL